MHPICDVQIEYSLISRGIESTILPTCRELGVGITAYGVLSRGLISGHWTKDRSTAPNDFRSHSPRFSNENIGHNLHLVEELRRVAESKGVTVAQLAIAWVLSRGVDVVPLVGARRRERLREALGAMKVTLTDDDVQQIERAVPVNAAAGDRYAAAQMSTLDSECNPLTQEDRDSRTLERRAQHIASSGMVLSGGSTPTVDRGRSASSAFGAWSRRRASASADVKP